MPGDRIVGVAIVKSESSKNALQWAIDNLLDKHDRLVLVHVLPHSNASIKSWKKSGSPLIPLCEFRQPRLAKQYCLTDFDAEILDMLDTASRQKEAKIVAKIYMGNIKKKLCEAVEDLELDSLVMGSSEGPRLLQRLFVGNITNYVVGNASCPVAVVKAPQIQIVKSGTVSKTLRWLILGLSIYLIFYDMKALYC